LDTVILAAGRGSRLAGIAAPFHKPLMVVNGQPLISSAVHTAYSATQDARVIVVAAPENAQPIASILSHSGVPYLMAVQPYPLGPGDALQVGLEMARSGDVMVLMGDNTFDTREVSQMVIDHRSTGARLSVGGHEMLIEDAERFTWLHDGVWREKTRPDFDYTNALKPFVWIGPVIIDRDRAYDWLSVQGRGNGRELAISPLFNEFTREETKLCSVSSVDIGVPEALS